jgi:hypothetical protein
VQREVVQRQIIVAHVHHLAPPPRPPRPLLRPLLRLLLLARRLLATGSTAAIRSVWLRHQPVWGFSLRAEKQSGTFAASVVANEARKQSTQAKHGAVQRCHHANTGMQCANKLWLYVSLLQGHNANEKNYSAVFT